MSESSATWRTVRFDQIADSIAERVEPAEADTDIYVGLEHLDPDSLRLRRWGTPADVEGTKLRFYTGDVIFGRRRAYQRKLAVADFEGICSAHAMVLRARPDVCLPEFLPFFLQSDRFFQRAMAISVGSLSPTINWKTLAVQEFPLPPLDEQRRIAEILWAVEETIEKITAAGQAIEATISAFRSEYFGADSGNPQYRLKDLCDPGGIQIGPFGSQLHASDYVSEGVPVIMPTDMTGDRIQEDNIAKISPAFATKLSTHKVLPGDILLPRRGELDRRAYIRPEQNGWLCGTGSLRIRVREAIPARAVFHALASPQAVAWLRSNAVGTTMPNLNASIVSNIPIALPEESRLNAILETLDRLNDGLHAAAEHRNTTLRLKTQLIECYW